MPRRENWALYSRDEQRVLDELKRLEHDGYEFEAAEASFELLVSKLRALINHILNCLAFA